MKAFVCVLETETAQLVALSRGSSQRGRPGREAGGQRRRGGPPPTGAAPGPSKSLAGSLLFLAGT